MALSLQRRPSWKPGYETDRHLPEIIRVDPTQSMPIFKLTVPAANFRAKMQPSFIAASWTTLSNTSNTLDADLRQTSQHVSLFDALHHHLRWCRLSCWSSLASSFNGTDHSHHGRHKSHQRFDVKVWPECIPYRVRKANEARMSVLARQHNPYRTFERLTGIYLLLTALNMIVSRPQACHRLRAKICRPRWMPKALRRTPGKNESECKTRKRTQTTTSGSLPSHLKQLHKARNSSCPSRACS